MTTDAIRLLKIGVCLLIFFFKFEIIIGSCANIKWNDNWVTFLDALLKLSMYHEIKNKPVLMYTRKIRKLEISPSLIQQIGNGINLQLFPV